MAAPVHAARRRRALGVGLLAAALVPALRAPAAHAAPPTAAAAQSTQPWIAPGREGSATPWRDLAQASEPASRAIQRRRYSLDHEVALQFGALPSSPFYKSYTGEIGYTAHFTPVVGWQVASFTYGVGVDTPLKAELLPIARRPDAHVSVPPLPAPIWALSSKLVIKPLYGKLALSEWALSHVEAFVLAGPAIVGISRWVGGNTVALGASAGFGIRLWLADAVSLRAEIADLLFVTGAGVGQVLHLQAGIALNFGGDS